MFAVIGQADWWSFLLELRPKGLRDAALLPTKPGSRVIPVHIPLKEAVDRFQQEPRAWQNAYDWYRQSAARNGTVSFNNLRVTAVKQGKQWMVDETDLEAALASQREQRGNLDQMRADYNSRILHPGTVRIAGAEARLTHDRAAVPRAFPRQFHGVAVTDRARAVSSCRRTQNRPQEEK